MLLKLDLIRYYIILVKFSSYLAIIDKKEPGFNQVLIIL